MSDYRDAFRINWMPGLTGLSRQPKAGIRDWLSKGTYAVSKSSKPNQIVLENINKQEILECFGTDINRFSVAAHESLCNLRQYEDIPRSTAWPLVILYYSTLFYSHALLRILGVSPSYFETTELLGLRNAANAYGVAEASKFKSGLYTFQVNMQQNQVLVTNEIKAGGSHEHMWKKLGESLTAAKNSLKGSMFPTMEQRQLEDEINVIQLAVAGAGMNASRLSAMRNSIQYRQKHGVWFPYQSSLTVQRLADRVRVASSNDVNLMQCDYGSKDELVAFYESCCLLLAVSRNTLLDLDKKSNKSFIRFGLPRIELTIPLN